MGYCRRSVEIINFLTLLTHRTLEGESLQLVHCSMVGSVKKADQFELVEDINSGFFRRSVHSFKVLNILLANCYYIRFEQKTRLDLRIGGKPLAVKLKVKWMQLMLFLTCPFHPSASRKSSLKCLLIINIMIFFW